MTKVITDPNTLGIYRLDRNGKLFVARREGIALSAYQDGPYKSIGIGSNDPNLEDGAKITLAEAFERFARDIEGRERDLSKRFGREPTQEQFNALFSCYYQSGNKAVPTLIRMHNAGLPPAAIRDTFPLRKFCKNFKGEFMPGLYKRRVLEGTLYATGQYEDKLDVLTVWHGNPRDRATRVEEITVTDEV